MGSTESSVSPRASDGGLAESVRNGDAEAFGSLYSRHLAMAKIVARKNVDNPSDVEDVVAEAFQSVLQSLRAGKGPDTFPRLPSQHRDKAGASL